ncbi:MAG: phosphoenolpyruvate--protein phosphotransferase, partial [Verrucomicrobia bacterium]|nr:phosphoenolpyruvate--protein phosphotransferase [Verrucomicrobiota bacterium]
MPERAPAGERIFRGIPVSPGVCRGRILVLGKSEEPVPHYHVPEAQVPQEVQRLEQGLIHTRHDILEVQRKVGEAMGANDASIFDAHLLVLEDATLLDEVTRLIQQDKVNVEFAFHKTAEKYAASLSAVQDEYLRERAGDLRDVMARVLNNLLGRGDESDLKHLTETTIIISHDLSPSTTAALDKKMVLGFGTDIGGKTSHTAIMARSLRIPAVVGLQSASKELTSGQYVLLDGFSGVLIVNPTDQTLFEYGQLERRQVDVQQRLRELRDKPAVCLDGTRIVLSANIEQTGDTENVLAFGAEGIGLFRTEF